MKLNCSCGSTSEFTDTFAGSVDARQWNETHAVCRSQQINQLRHDIHMTRERLTAVLETLKTVRNNVAIQERNTHLFAAATRRRYLIDIVSYIDIKMNEINSVHK